MKNYRVFVTRHYIAVRFFDVRATSPKKAKTLARSAAYTICADARNEASDNTWLADEPQQISRLGKSSTGINKLKFILKRKEGGVYQFAQ